MSTGLSIKRPRRTNMFFGAFFAIFALLLQPLVSLNIPAVFAVPHAIYGPETAIVDGSTPYDTGPINTTGYDTLDLSFEYDHEALDNGDSFTYEVFVNGVSTATDTINGANGDTPGFQIVNAFNSAATASNVRLEITASTNTASDNVQLQNIILTGEAIPATHLAAEEFVTVNGSYKGISVGFNAKNFGTVTEIKADMTRADGSHVVKTSGPGVLQLINGASWDSGDGKLTVPFVIQEGTFTEASDTDGDGDLYWQPAPAITWSNSTTPTSVTITVTDENGDESVTNDTFNQGAPSWPTYESLLPPVTPPANTVVTVDENSTDWFGFVDGTPNGSHTFVDGPSTPPLGDGSLELTVDSTGRYNFATLNFAGERLDEIVSLDYSSYRQNGGSALAPSLQLDFDNDLTDADTAWKGRMVYEPYHDNTVADTTWQAWAPTSDEAWWFSGAPGNTVCPQSNPCTFDEVKTAFPNGGIRAGVGLVQFKAGGPWAPGFTGNVDAFTFASANFNVTHDFEPLPADTTAPSVQFTSPANNATVRDLTISAEMDGTGSNLTRYGFDVTGPAGSGISFSTRNYSIDQPSLTVTDLDLCAAAYYGSCPADLPNGTYKIRAKAYDAAGNRNISTSLTLTIDRTAPTFTIKPGSVGSDPIFQKVSFKLHDGGKIDKVTINGVVKNLSNNQWSDLNGVKPGTFGAVEGDNVLVIYDVAGNTTTYEFTLDTTAPVTPVGLKRVHSESGDVVACGTVAMIRSLDPAWDAYGGADFDYYNYETRKGHTDTFTTNYFETNGWVPSADGSNGFRVQTVDKAGNVSTWSDWCDITFDSTAPVVTLHDLVDGETYQGPVDIVVSIIDVNLSHYYLSIWKDGSQVVTPETFKNKYVSGLIEEVLETVSEEGDYTVRIAARDKAGNKDGDASADGDSVKTISFTIDNPSLTDDEEEEQQVSFTPPLFNPTIFANTPIVQPFQQGFAGNNPVDEAVVDNNNDTDDLDDIDNSEILGEQDNESGTPLEDTGEVLGIMDQKFFGIAWYWWLVALAALIGGWLLLAAAIRRNRAEE